MELTHRVVNSGLKCAYVICYAGSLVSYIDCMKPFKIIWGETRLVGEF